MRSAFRSFLSNPHIPSALAEPGCAEPRLPTGSVYPLYLFQYHPYRSHLALPIQDAGRGAGPTGLAGPDKRGESRLLPALLRSDRRRQPYVRPCFTRTGGGNLVLLLDPGAASLSKAAPAHRRYIADPHRRSWADRGFALHNLLSEPRAAGDQRLSSDQSRGCAARSRRFGPRSVSPYKRRGARRGHRSAAALAGRASRDLSHRRPDRAKLFRLNRPFASFSRARRQRRYSAPCPRNGLVVRGWAFRDAFSRPPWRPDPGRDGNSLASIASMIPRSLQEHSIGKVCCP